MCGWASDGWGMSRTAVLTEPGSRGYVVLDFTAFDAWYEEDERNVAHPRDPFHRIDTVPSSRHVRLEMDGAVRAESSRPTLLFETMLPPCFYLPPNDVEAELVPSEKRTYCAHKGEAAYSSLSASTSSSTANGSTARSRVPAACGYATSRASPQTQTQSPSSRQIRHSQPSSRSRSSICSGSTMFFTMRYPLPSCSRRSTISPPSGR